MASPGLDGTGAWSPDAVHWDVSYHRMAYWDDHTACSSCLNKMGTGIFCSESEACNVCVQWGPDGWLKIWHAEVRWAWPRPVRAESMDSQVARPQSTNVIGSMA